ncbi:MAG: hypothetical protein Nkreftii_001484 [Candidatus Nitrospira kreftii]|uniref:Uncharacterized protein n=1 Tax=Candidatus Nitrospira kreftii TaxID=2652173 RepID=A0A7S8FD47_9BACT|nr:MAG: hypothetical protein Nkreftii_001484 [Candidatus Nitrospira kreftii]
MEGCFNRVWGKKGIVTSEAMLRLRGGAEAIRPLTTAAVAHRQPGQISFNNSRYVDHQQLSAASAGEDLPLSVSVPTGDAEMDRRMGQAVDQFHPLFDDHSTIGTGAGRHRWWLMLLDSHESLLSCSDEHVDYRLRT